MTGGAPATLWDFSLAVYARPGVGAACLDLQARFGVDVNLLLAVLWTGATGRGRLSAGEVATLAAAVGALHADVVKPLRAARIALKAPAASDPGLAALRVAVQRVELDAERAEQGALEAILAPRPAGVPGVERAADALANMAAYLTYMGASAAESGAAACGPITRAIAGDSTT